MAIESWKVGGEGRLGGSEGAPLPDGEGRAAALQKHKAHQKVGLVE